MPYNVSCINKIPKMFIFPLVSRARQALFSAWLNLFSSNTINTFDSLCLSAFKFSGYLLYMEITPLRKGLMIIESTVWQRFRFNLLDQTFWLWAHWAHEDLVILPVTQNTVWLDSSGKESDTDYYNSYVIAIRDQIKWPREGSYISQVFNCPLNF